MKRFFIFILFILPVLAIIFWATAKPVPAGTRTPQPDFDQYELLIVTVPYENAEQVAQIAQWTEPWHIDRQAQEMTLGVTPTEYQLLLESGYQAKIDQLATTKANQPNVALPNQGGGIPGYPCYRTVEETFATAQQINANYPDFAEWIDIGDSWEKTNNPANGYDLMVLRLTNENIGGDKPKLFIMTGLHAREYTPVELNSRFAEYLIANYGIDPDVTWMLDHQEFHLLFQSNPDGRKHAETGLYWRKNVNQNYCSPTSSNRGADLNRNFEFQWGCCNGSSGNQCDSTYRGPAPASEPEIPAIQSYVRSIFPDQRLPNLTAPAPITATGVFFDIHSSGELVLWPWGFTSTPAPNSTALQTFGRKLAYFNSYYPEQAIGLYPTDGTTDDFGYGDLGVAAYTFELGTQFFQSCTTFENSILPDNLPALIYAGKSARTPYLTPAGPDTLNLQLSANPVSAGSYVTLTATINDTRFNLQNGIEPSQPISSAMYTIDTPIWDASATPTALSASDGTFNSSVEGVTAVIDTTGYSVGRHIIYLHGQDNAGNWGAVSAIFLDITDPIFNPTLVVTKTATVNTAWAGDIFTYTLEQSLNFAGSYPVTQTVTDSIPTELTVLTNTIQLNGVPAPQLYDSATHMIHHNFTDQATDGSDMLISFQVQVNSGVISGTQVVNSLISSGSAGGVPASSPTSPTAIVTLIDPNRYLYFPVIFKDG